VGIVKENRDWATWFGLGVVGAAAAIMSFTALSDLARLLGVTALMNWPGVEAGGIPVAWLLPLTVDVLAAVATRVWLTRRTNHEALEYARRAAWAAIVATVVGNGAHGYLVSAATGEPWAASVVVSAVPALALGAMVHLAHLVGRGPAMPVDEAGPDPWLTLLDDVLAEPWDHAIRAWAAAVDEDGARTPTRDEPDAVLAADLRGKNVNRRRPFTQDEVRFRYGVGATRAGRLRDMAQQPPAPTAVPLSVAGA